MKTRKHYDFGEINWDEFWNVVKGNGPCNKQRLEARKKAHEEGAWVSEAAIAYADKRKQNVLNPKQHEIFQYEHQKFITVISLMTTQVAVQ